jgi:leucyl-tRNA synthetase
VDDGYAQVDGVVAGFIIKDDVINQPDEIATFLSGCHSNSKDVWPMNTDAYPFCYQGEGVMVNSNFLDGISSKDAISAMMDHLEKQGWGKRVTTYHLRDWLISRQRYWGPPIPMIYCKACADCDRSWFSTDEANSMIKNTKSQTPNLKQISKSQNGQNSKHVELGTWNLELAKQGAAGWYPVPEDQLPVVLPRIEDYKPGNDGVAPLAKHKEFYQTTCPGCGRPATRETDVSDTFLDSSWYFLRYPSVSSVIARSEATRQSRTNLEIALPSDSPRYRSGEAGRSRNDKLPWDPTITKRWLPVSMYTGGAEHSVLHLLYSRFVTMALKDWGYIDFEEPFPNFFAHGLVIKDGAKMSKSKGNVINPDEYIKLYGTDALRLYLMFMGPFSEGGDFRDSAMEGMSRWVGRIWKIGIHSLDTMNKLDQLEITKALHRLIKKVGEDTEARRYNTAIAAMMEFTNLVADHAGTLSLEALRSFLVILSPYAPHLTEELWSRCEASRIHDVQSTSGQQWSVHQQLWPTFDSAQLEDETVTIVVQINGKLRDNLHVARAQSTSQSAIDKIARQSVKIAKYLSGVSVKKIIYIPGKLLNYVV